MARQAADAIAALTHSFHDIGKGLNESAKEHPLLALGVAAVAGAVIARAVSPSSRNGERERSSSEEMKEHTTVLGSLLVDTFKPVIQSLLLTVAAEITQPIVRSNADSEKAGTS